MSSAERHLLSWVRDGLAARVTGEDPGSGAIPARATLATQLTLTTEQGGVDVNGRPLALHGPGDVTGIDPRQVVRTDPAPDATNFESTHLALVEFDDPALPWRLTPLAPAGGTRLRPWLVLVVVDAAAPGVALRTDPRRPLPVLECPLSELPDLAKSAAWAHADVAATAGETVAQLLAERPERTVARLLAPRRLQPERTYLACVVPAFEHGRLAGLGEDVPATPTTAPAWPGAGATVTLPVYYRWRFSTGAAGDFPALARRLRPAVLGSGELELSYKPADPSLVAALGDDPGILPLLPALTLPGLTQGGTVNAGYATALAAILARGAQAVVPPIYAAAYLDHGPGWTGGEPLWMRELNLDPRLRAAAGLGAEVIRRNQDALMASAWEQAAALERANATFAQGRLGRAVSESLHRRHFDVEGLAAAARAKVARRSLGGERAARAAAVAVAEQGDLVVQRSATALRRIATRGGTVAGDLETHEPTASTASPDVQRALRPTGPAARAGGATTAEPLPPALTPIATGEIVPAPPVPAASDAAVLDRYTGDRTDYRFRDITAAVVGAAPPWWQNLATLSQALVPPGPFGFQTDLVALQQSPQSESAPAPGTPLMATLMRRLDFDGEPAVVDAPRPIPNPTSRADVAGGLLARGQGDAPQLLLCGVERNAWTNPWTGETTRWWIPGIRWIAFAADGTPQPRPWEALNAFFNGGVSGADIALRRRPGQPDSAAEIVLGYKADGAAVRSFALDSKQPIGAERALPIYWPASDVAIEFIPVSVGAGAPYVEPRDLLFAYVYASSIWVAGSYPVSTWAISWQVGRNFGTPQETWTAMQTTHVMDRVSGQERGARLSVAVSDFDGDGEPEVIVHLSFERAQPSGPPQPVTFRRIGHGLRPDGTVREWEAGAPLALAPPPAGGSTLCVAGDLDSQRAARISQIGDRFKLVAQRHQGVLIRPATAGEQAQPASYEVGAVAAGVSAALDPRQTVTAAVGDRVSLDGAALPAPAASSAPGPAAFGAPAPAASSAPAPAASGAPAPAASGAPAPAASGAPDPLRARVYEPRFPQAMAEPLRELYPELVFPAADALPDDGVALLGGNSELIAAYLAGLNHEFGRELLWRGFPTSGRATWFAHFFDARGVDPASAPGDIVDLGEWGTLGDLAGKAAGAASQDSVILIVRGELLRRYPRVIVSAARAVVTAQGRQPAAELVHPAFTGRAGADVSLFSFPIGAATVRGGGSDPGWFFLFSEPPTEPRFAATAEPDWTQPSAHAAAALLRLSARVAIHASTLLAPA